MSKFASQTNRQSDSAQGNNLLANNLLNNNQFGNGLLDNNLLGNNSFGNSSEQTSGLAEEETAETAANYQTTSAPPAEKLVTYIIKEEKNGKLVETKRYKHELVNLLLPVKGKKLNPWKASSECEVVRVYKGGKLISENLRKLYVPTTNETYSGKARNLMDGKNVEMGSMEDLKKLKNEDYDRWKDMLKFENSQEYQDVYDKADEGRVIEPQRMEEAYGSWVNTDYYAIRIYKESLPKEITMTVLFNAFRKTLPTLFDKSVSDDLFAYDDASQKLWDSDNPTGAVMVFNTKMDDSGVLTSQSSPAHWVFTPVFTFDDLGHPLAGHREFGIIDNGDQTYTIYTRGIDLLWDGGTMAYDYLLGPEAFFKDADKLWNAVMDKAAEQIMRFNSEIKVEKTHNFTRRIPWNDNMLK